MVWIAAFSFIESGNCATPAATRIADENPLANPEVGAYGLRVLSPTLLELTLVNTKDSISARVPNWDFVSDNFAPNLPAASAFTVTTDSQIVGVSGVGFKRRPLYAPAKYRDLRIGNYLYLKLSTPLADGAAVEVKNPAGDLWTAPTEFSATVDALRFNPAIHVNEVGYMPTGSKTAMVGYYLGSFGEMDIPSANGFKLVRASDGAAVFSGTLRQRADVGFTYSPLPYQKVYEADFSTFTTPGEYRLQVPGMGASFSFVINEGVAATFARTFAMGLYHQRCGAELDLPYTRHDHGFCHTNLVDIPTMAFTFTQNKIAEKSSDYAREPRHTAPQLKSTDTSLYPFVNQGKIDVSKGHHDAGDYSKYTINSAGLIHHLVFAADSFAGVGALDNLGLPESGDGKSDLLQEAKWEADYLAKMQDSDGGFYFLVYPKEREYENDVTPDHGDAQVVWPKTTAVTAAATAALAEIASSPRFKQQFPEEAASYMAKAQSGWNFLTTAIAKYGKDGAYQKITHYGNEFMHDDELAWAASAMFAATGNSAYFAKLKEWLPNPNSQSVQRWGWWRLYEGWGCAIRTYAFAARSGRVPAAAMDAAYLNQCANEIIFTADDQARFSRESAYGTSYPNTSKAIRSAGWFFSSERAFDITVGYQLDAKPEYKSALFANLNYEGGCNPMNYSYVTGLGWKRQRDIVHDFAKNDRRILPPPGIPLGNILPGFAYLDPYLRELTLTTFPADDAATAPYAMYDRQADSFNTMAEFVVVDEARCLGSLAFWMAQSSLGDQPWKSGTAQITNVPAELAVGASATLGITSPGVDLSGAVVTWEVRYLEPGLGTKYTLTPKYPGDTWIEAEALLPDGRRVYAKTNFTATTDPTQPANAYQSAPVSAGLDTAAIYHLDRGLTEATAKHMSLTLRGGAFLDGANLGWLANQFGTALRFLDLGDRAEATLPAASILTPDTTFLSVEAMIYINSYKGFNRGNASILRLQQSSLGYLAFGENLYEGPRFNGGTNWEASGDSLKALTAKTWHHLRLRLDKDGYTATVNGDVVSSKASSDLAKWNLSGIVTLQLGDFDGWIDEVVVRSSTVSSGGGPYVTSTLSLTAMERNLVAPATVTLVPSSTDANNTITKVEFFDGATRIGESRTAPFGFTWNGVFAGTHLVTARATDNRGDVATSAPMTIVVEPKADPAGNPVPAAAFVRVNTTARGDWRGVFGAEGYKIIGDTQKIPAYVTMEQSGATDYIWSTSTGDPRGLQQAAGVSRVAAVWTSPLTFNMDFSFKDNRAHRVSLYVMDWDRTGRAQKFEVVDPSDVVLNSVEVSDFGDGKYLTWDLSGDVRIRTTRLAGNNVIVEALFFDPAPAPSVISTLRMVGFSRVGAPLLEITGTVGSTYAIQSSVDIKTWRNVGNATITASPMIFSDVSPTAGELRIYRIAPAN